MNIRRCPPQSRKRDSSPRGGAKAVWTVLMLVSFVSLLGFAGGLEQDLLGFMAGVIGMAGSLGGFWLFGKLSGVIR